MKHFRLWTGPTALQSVRQQNQCEMCAQAEEARQREVGAGMAERDRRSAELREQLENDAAILRRAQKAVDAERAAQKVFEHTMLMASVDFGITP